MRKPPKESPLAIKPKSDTDMITQVRRYKLITPLFGGGVEPGQADPITVVRATEVRGHLRFWWRATRGGQFGGDLAKMQEAEERIWGSAAAEGRSGPSPIKISINLLERGRPFQAVDRNGSPVSNIGHPRSIDSYAAFPLRDMQNPHVVENVQFELEIDFPREVDGYKTEPEVKAALWAWETFGGMGARTRRGFGALHCTHVNGEQEFAPSGNQMLDSIDQGLRDHVVEGTWHPDVPHLSRDINRYRVSRNEKPIDVWRFLIGRLRRFRQARQGFHRSKWPEPDEIRRRMGTQKRGHEPVHPVRKFPRAAFGLPINFEFKQTDVPPEPGQTILQGADHERLASPLILRPVACAGRDNAVGLAAILNAPIEPPNGWLLKNAPSKPGVPPIQVELTSAAEANAIEPLKDLGNMTDVLLAFLETI